MLLTQEGRRALPRLYAQEGVSDPTVHLKFFTPDSHWTWFVLEGEPLVGEGGQELDFTFFGLVDGEVAELGYFSLMELQAARGPWGLKIERDGSFSPRPLSAVREEIEKKGESYVVAVDARAV